MGWCGTLPQRTAGSRLLDDRCVWSYANSMSFAYCETHHDYHRTFMTPPTICPTAKRSDEALPLYEDDEYNGRIPGR